LKVSPLPHLKGSAVVYHSDAVLELGSVPLHVVTARVDRFIAEGGKGPFPDMQ
jgi:hypothetical protein